MFRFGRASRRKVWRRSEDEIEWLGRMEIAKIAVNEREAIFESVVANALARETNRLLLRFDSHDARGGKTPCGDDCHRSDS